MLIGLGKEMGWHRMAWRGEGVALSSYSCWIVQIIPLHSSCICILLWILSPIVC